MRIVSQNKSDSLDLDDFVLSIERHGEFEVIRAYTHCSIDNAYWILGGYKTEKRTAEVFDEIHRFYEKHWHCDNPKVFYMPEK